ncbi:MAG: adenylosuccinate synthetase, partial [Haloarculaceae archaeon]
VTGRPRRVGWLDVPMLRHAARANGFTGLAVNHLDVLAGMDTVEVGHSYTLDGEEVFTMPATTEKWGRCEANFREFDGWPDVDWAAVAEEGYEAIPENARAYLEYLEAELDAPVYAVGVGPGREETVVVEDVWE